MKEESPLRVFATFAVFALASAAICGCVDTAKYYSDREHFRERLNEQSHRIYEIERDMISLKRGYRTIPVNVTITNAWEATSCQ